MAEDRMLQEAIDALKSGQRSRAKDLLTRLLRTDQNNVEYWLYMSTVVDTRKERTFCLENALKIDPDNQTAKRGLVMIGALPPDEGLKPIKPERKRKWDIGTVYAADGTDLAASQKRGKTNLPLIQIVGLGLIGVLIAGILFVGLTGTSYSPSEGLSFGGSMPTLTQAPATETPMYTPTVPIPTPLGGDLPAASLLDPTPLSAYLDATYTPTPRYVETPHANTDYDAGLAALEQGNYEEAIESLLLFINSNVTDVDSDARYYLGLAYMGIEEYEEARDSFSLALNLDETFGPAYMGRAQAWLGINPESNVADDLNKAVNYSPDFLEAYLVRAAYRLERENMEGAIADAEIALEIAPDNGLAYHYLATAYMKLEQLEEALEAARTAHELDSTIIYNYYVLGYTLVETGEVAEAYTYLQTYLPFDKENAIAWYSYGRAQQVHNYHESALASFKQALTIQQDIWVINYYRGISYLALEDYENAIDRLGNAVRIFPDWVEARVALAEALYLSGDALQSNLELENTTSSVQTDEQWAALYYWRALTFEALERYELAERDWNLMLDLSVDVMPSEWRTEAVEHLQDISTALTPLPDLPTLVPTMTPAP
jgi:tetratricopeptide (TPR) repeat protein